MENSKPESEDALGHELAMMHTIAKALADLEPEARQRAWLWAGQAYCNLPVPQIHRGEPGQEPPAERAVFLSQLPEGHPLRVMFEQAQNPHPDFPGWGH